MTNPVITKNGTDPQSLLENLSLAKIALQSAEGRIGESAPNGRDYPGESINQACREHRNRMMQIADVRHEIEKIMEAVADQM